MAISPDTPDKITYFAETDYRSKRVKFGIRDDDRAKHMYIIGKTGMGKSTMLENLAVQDIQNGEGLCFIDPHGGTAETLLSYVPEHRIKDVIYFAPFDQEFPVALNVMEDMGKDKRPLIASGLIGAFKKVWVDAWSARMEYLLSNALLALFETPGSTLLGVNRMFADKNYRNMIVANVTDPSVKSFWVDEFAKYSDKFATEATAAIQNKIGQFAANPLIRNMVGQPKSTFDIRDVMDNRKILIVNLSKGRMGEGNANLVGSMLITKIYLAAMSRADVGAEVVKGLPPFYLYVDEFQSFANESFADILSEARKYKLSLTIAHQYIEQMSEEVRAAVFGNVGSMVSFRVGAYDAEVLEKEYAPAFTAEDMVNLGFAQIYLKLMIRGVGSSPFSATTLPPVKKPVRDFAPDVIASSRALFARPREQVEEEIKKWHEPIPDAPRDPNAPIPETRKYAPGTRPPPRVDNGTARPATPRLLGGASAPYVPQRQADPESLRFALQSVLPQKAQEEIPALSVTPAPLVSASAIPSSTQIPELPKAPKFVVPRAPYAQPLNPALTPVSAISVPRSPMIVPQKETPPEKEKLELPIAPVQTQPVMPSAPTVHRPFAEQFAKLKTEEAPVSVSAEPRIQPVPVLQTPPAPSRSPLGVLPSSQEQDRPSVPRTSIDRRGDSEQEQPRIRTDKPPFVRRAGDVSINPPNREQQVVERRPDLNRTPGAIQPFSSERRLDKEVGASSNSFARHPVESNRIASSGQVPPPERRFEKEPPAPQTPASLSLLKSSPKKDKGPSEEHLSSLREVLRTASLPKTESTHRGEYINTQPAPSSSPTQPTSAPKEEPKAEFLPSSLEVEISSYVPPPPVPEQVTIPPPPQVSAVPPITPLQRASYAQEPKAPLRPMEIPEDVLNNLLAD